ncbi:hypothetical protein PR048_032805 [Dryococelus australis]|uniref:Uncharacterized protein n=1 Tax=Dryococelus australis TaxID=614101 RepID=A0ABQ9G406_9NEOP|nr:hypothetical protein PR048_032805 [Dryococelus australis]
MYNRADGSTLRKSTGQQVATSTSFPHISHHTSVWWESGKLATWHSRPLAKRGYVPWQKTMPSIPNCEKKACGRIEPFNKETHRRIIESAASLSYKLKIMEQEIMLLNMKRQESENRLENKNLKQQLLQVKILHKPYPKLVLKKSVGQFEEQIDRFLTKKKCCWEKEDIAAAITLRSVSLKAYVYMRNKVNLPLPGLSTVRKWARNLGIQTEVLTVLEVTSKVMNEIKRSTILLFDEINVDSRLYYDQSEDKILGPNRNVQVIIARGLASKWKQPMLVERPEYIMIQHNYQPCGFLQICAIKWLQNDFFGLQNTASLWNKLILSPKLTPLQVQLKGNTRQKGKFAVQRFSHHTPRTTPTFTKIY